MVNIEITTPIKKIETTEYYKLVIVDANNKYIFFDKNGEYDGWDVSGYPSIVKERQDIIDKLSKYEDKVMHLVKRTNNKIDKYPYYKYIHEDILVNKTNVEYILKTYINKGYISSGILYDYINIQCYDSESVLLHFIKNDIKGTKGICVRCDVSKVREIEVMYLSKGYIYEPDKDTHRLSS